MKTYLLLISIWGYNGQYWEYTGNQYVMKELMTLEECEYIIDESNWDRHENNIFYRAQFDCVIDSYKEISER